MNNRVAAHSRSLPSDHSLWHGLRTYFSPPLLPHNTFKGVRQTASRAQDSFPRDWHPDCSFGKMVQAQCPRDTLELEAARSRPNFCKPTALGHQSGPNLSSAPTGDSQLRHSGCCLLRRIPPSLPGWTGMPSDLSAGRQNQLRVRLTRRCTQGTPRLLSGLFQLHTKPGLWPVLQHRWKRCLPQAHSLSHPRTF